MDAVAFISGVDQFAPLWTISVLAIRPNAAGVSLNIQLDLTQPVHKLRVAVENSVKTQLGLSSAANIFVFGL